MTTRREEHRARDNASRENARLVLNYTSAENALGRSARRAAQDVLDLHADRDSLYESCRRLRVALKTIIQTSKTGGAVEIARAAIERKDVESEAA